MSKGNDTMRNRDALLRTVHIFAATAIAALTAHAQQTTATAWQTHADAVRKMPGLLRFYSFKDAETAQLDLAGSLDAMMFKGAKDAVPATEPGRVAERSAVVLDSESFEAAALTFPTNAFTVSLWVRPIATGTKTGNADSVNGMIACSGSGYTDGWRIAIYDWKTRRPTIEIGREKGAFGLRANDGLSTGFWNHLAATWDGAAVRLYVNGMLSAEQRYEGTLVPPKASLKLGYAGFGVGSLKLAADELVVFDRALPPEQITDISLSGIPLPETTVKAVARAFLRSADDDDRAALDACIALFDDAQSVPAHLRGMAIERLAAASRNGAELPSRVLEKLPEFMELDADAQRQSALLLAEAYARENKTDAAADVFDHLLSFPDLLPNDTAEIRHRYARVLRQGSRFDAAREQYAKIAEDAQIVPHVRAIASLELAQTWRQENKLEEAAAAFLSAANTTNAPAHLTDEALASAAECSNVLANLPMRDPEASRRRLLPLPAPAITYFVAPKGSDRNPGTIEQPFATLERARDAIRAQRVNNSVLPPGGTTVYLRGGTYSVTNTFTLTEADSGNASAPIVYRAWRDERPVFDGGFRVNAFSKVRDPAILARLPQEAQGKVRVADVKAQGYTSFDAQKGYGYGINNQAMRELFQDGQPLQPARWPNAGFAMTGEVLDPTNRVFTFASDRLDRWALATDMMANGYWYHLWAVCAVPTAPDAAAGTLRLVDRPNYGLRAGQPFYVLNLLEEIDQPGEWFLDRANGLLYVWPTASGWFSASTFTLSRWDKPFIKADNVRDVAFVGLTLEYGQQHGIILNGCINAVVANCVIRRMGGTALTAPQSANLKVYGNLFHTLGHSGMHVTGGNRKNLTSGQVSIENNEVHHFGRCSRTYNPAVLLEGCGARVAHNHFHHAPSSAMRIEGNDHLIEFNDVHHVVQESDDQGGIDMWGNPSYRGVVIRHNRWRDIGGGDHAPCGQAGIRFDDAISGMLVYGNLFERTSTGNFGGVQIHGGHNNIIDSNVFVDCNYGVSFSPWGMKRWNEYLNLDRIQKHLFTEVNIRTLPYSRRYPELAELGKKADINSFWRNTFIGCNTSFYKKPAGTDEWDNRSLPAGTATAPHPFDAAGLYDDPMRAKE